MRIRPDVSREHAPDKPSDFPPPLLDWRDVFKPAMAAVLFWAVAVGALRMWAPLPDSLLKPLFLVLAGSSAFGIGWRHSAAERTNAAPPSDTRAPRPPGRQPMMS